MIRILFEKLRKKNVIASERKETNEIHKYFQGKLHLFNFLYTLIFFLLFALYKAIRVTQKVCFYYCSKTFSLGNGFL